MTDEMLASSIVRILYRVHPAPLRRETLASECEVALSRVLSKEEFDRELGALVQRGLVRTGRIGILGNVESLFLSQTGFAEAARIFG